MKRKFSIITTCKGRLEHLKQSLPAMVAQDGADVVVVDYSCPERAGDWVESAFPSVQVVRVEGEEGFSNWRARNLGAEVAKGDMLLFCDADTVLAPNATDAIAKSMPDDTYGFFKADSTAHFNKSGLRLGRNQLRGFQVVPAEAFRELGGYDDVPIGWGAGGDTDLEERLVLLGVKPNSLGDGIVEEVFEHDNAARTAFHKAPIRISYAAGLLYRRAKMALMRIRRTTNLPREERENLYNIARRAAARLARGANETKIRLNIENQVVGMPRQLGFGQGKCVVSINVELDMQNPMPIPPR